MNLAQALQAGDGLWSFPGEGQPPVRLDVPPEGYDPTAPTTRRHSADDVRQSPTNTMTAHILAYLSDHPGSTSIDVAQGVGCASVTAVSNTLSSLHGSGRVRRVEVPSVRGKMYAYHATPEDDLPEPQPRGGGHRRGLLRFSVCKVLLARTATRTELYAACDERVRDGLDSLLTRMLERGEVTRKRDPMAASYAYTLTQRGRDLATGRA